MKNRLFYGLAVLAIAFGMFVGADIRQSPPDPVCPPWICE